MERVVFDTNVLVSAALWPDSLPAQALQTVAARCDLVYSEDSLGELQAVFSRPKFDRWASAAHRQIFVDWVRQHATPVTVQPEHMAQTQGICRDEGDAPFLALALAANARWLVSGDQDLLTLQRWQGVSIVDAAGFIQTLGG